MTYFHGVKLFQLISLFVIYAQVGFCSTPISISPPDSVMCQDQLIFNWGEMRSIHYIKTGTKEIFAIDCSNDEEDTVLFKKKNVEKILLADGKIYDYKKVRKSENKIGSGAIWLIASVIVLTITTLIVIYHGLNY